MECVSLESRLIASAAYFRREMKLCVWFNSGRCAWHNNVTEAMFNNLAKADSAGFYYSNYIANRREAHQRKTTGFLKLAGFSLLSLLMVGMSDMTYRKSNETTVARSDFSYLTNATSRWSRW